MLSMRNESGAAYKAFTPREFLDMAPPPPAQGSNLISPNDSMSRNTSSLVDTDLVTLIANYN